MRKSCKRFLALLLSSVLTFSMAGQALAADTTPQAAEAAQEAVLDQVSGDTSPALFGIRYSDYLTLNKPKDNAVYYKGESIPVSLTIDDVGDDYLALTVITALNQKSGDNLWEDYIFEDGGVYTVKVPTKKFPAGSYVLAAATALMDIYSEEEEPINNIEDSVVFASFTLKTLKAPTSLKTTAGKRKVTITYKKATGATKYEIYRSTQKSKGYKKIATTTKTKYVDTKAKKGKKYYYKVRSVRTGNGTAYSSYTSAKRTGKVK